jgi:hypothetical protein
MLLAFYSCRNSLSFIIRWSKLVADLLASILNYCCDLSGRLIIDPGDVILTSSCELAGSSESDANFFTKYYDRF